MSTITVEEIMARRPDKTRQQVEAFHGTMTILRRSFMETADIDVVAAMGIAETMDATQILFSTGKTMQQIRDEGEEARAAKFKADVKVARDARMKAVREALRGTSKRTPA